MHRFGWLLERGSNFFNLLQKERVPSEKGGGEVPTLEETMSKFKVIKQTIAPKQ